MEKGGNKQGAFIFLSLSSLSLPHPLATTSKTPKIKRRRNAFFFSDQKNLHGCESGLTNPAPGSASSSNDSAAALNASPSSGHRS